MTLKIITQINHIQISHQLKWKKIYKLKENIKDLLTLMKQIFIKILLVSPPAKEKGKNSLSSIIFIKTKYENSKKFCNKTRWNDFFIYFNLFSQTIYDT